MGLPLSNHLPPTPSMNGALHGFDHSHQEKGVRELGKCVRETPRPSSRRQVKTEEPARSGKPSFFGASSRLRAKEVLGFTDSTPMPPGMRNALPRAHPDAPVMYGAHLAQMAFGTKPPPREASAALAQVKQRAVTAMDVVDRPRVPPGLQWLRVSDDSELISNGYPTDAPCVNYSKELQSTGIPGTALQILTDLLGAEDVAELELHHDAEWKIFPEIGEAIKKYCGERLPSAWH